MAKELVTEVEAFAKEMLPSDSAAWCKRFRGHKIIHDSLWGTFRVEAHELALIDTPLLQRLRFIRQTGAVYLIYPSALHTRFEHSLGVLCQAGRLCVALRRSAGEKRIDEGFEAHVRFAALLHDTGHGPFSHTSEEYYSAMPSLVKQQEEDRFAERGGGEILSCLLVESQAMRDFVDAINSTFKRNLSIDTICNMIIGNFDDREHFKGEIIHGPFDADKLDYLARDALFSGIKMHVDLDRLFHSIEVHRGQRIPEVFQTRIAGKLAGISPLTQIMFNKMLLFTGIYHHHKVRTVDCMLRAVFDQARELKATVGGVRLDSPVAFLRTTDDRLLIPELSDSEVIRSLIERIRNRQLWYRALTISHSTVPAEMHSKLPGTEEGRFAAIAHLSGSKPAELQQKREIADEIWTEAKKPCARYEVWLDIPKVPLMTEARDMWILTPGLDRPQTLGEVIPIAEWVELYGMHQQRSHVFCPQEYVDAVGKAAVAVLDRRFGLKFSPLARSYKNLPV